MNPMESSLIEILNQILSELTQIKSILSIRSDQDLSNQSNQIRSDQIRSDQISKECSKKVENWKELFTEALDLYGLDYENLSIDSVESGANYYLTNQRQIASKKGYLKKVLSTATKTSPSKKKTSESSLPSKKTVDPHATDILGLPRELVEGHRHLLSNEIYSQLIPFLDESYLKFMGDYYHCTSRLMTHNIAVAMCINHGLITV